jgi:hypothetical protein
MNIDTVPDGIHFRFTCTQCQQEKLGSSPTLITAIWPDGIDEAGQPRWEYQEHNACTSCKLKIDEHNAQYEPIIEAQQAARVAALPKPEWSIKSGEPAPKKENRAAPAAKPTGLPQQQAAIADVFSQLSAMMLKQMQVLEAINTKLEKPKRVRKQKTTDIEEAVTATV